MARNIFNSIQAMRPQTNMIDLSHDHKLSFNMGELIPVQCTAAVPGDKVSISYESLVKLAPMVAPMMHRCNLYFHTFFVPWRLVWPNVGKYLTVDENLPAFPFINITGFNWTRLADYLGIPSAVGGAIGENVSAIPFAVYQMIFNEYYRGQDFVNEVPFELADGNNAATQASLMTLRKRAWKHDYFTAALPSPQKNAAVDLPLGDVVLNPDWNISGSSPHFKEAGGTTDSGTLTQTNTGQGVLHLDPGQLDNQAYDPDGSLRTEATTINDLRRAEALQKFLEAMARGGSRLIEYIWNIFGVKSSDKRLQRPEYIAGSVSPIIISEVLNTTGTSTQPQGDMSGHGVAVANSRSGRFFVEEHGYVMTIMSVLPETGYMQGISKDFLKINDPYELFIPHFQHIGEQEILNKELYAYQLGGDGVFGYVPRYSEYKFENNRVSGDFRTSLDHWHMVRKFATPPALNSQFIESDPTHRIFAVEDPAIQKLYAHVYFKMLWSRPMAKYGTPKL